MSKGKTPVLASEEASALLKGMDVSTAVAGLRDRALIAVMTYTFARVGAVAALKVEDYLDTRRWWLRLHEKNGKVNGKSCHHSLEAYLDANVDEAGLIDASRASPLFRSAVEKTRQISEKALSRVDVWNMVRRRAEDAGIATRIACHTFRATGTTDHLKNDGHIEIAQRMAGHSNSMTTGLYDRRNADISLDEVAARVKIVVA